MTLIPLIAVGLAGGSLAWLLRDRQRLGSVVGLVGLAAAAVLAWLLRDAAPTPLAGEPVAVDGYVRLFVLLAALVGILTTLLSVVLPRPATIAGADPAARPAPAFLLFVAAAVLALGIVSPVTALVPAAAGGVAGFVAIGRLRAVAARRGGRADEALDEVEAEASSRRLGFELLRIAAALAVAATAVELLVGNADAIAGSPVGVGAASLALALAVAIRIGAVPIHGHAVRLMETTERAAVPIVSVWGPALFALVALGALNASVIPIGLPLSVERGIVAGFAVLTVIAGGLAALAQDDVERVAAYSIVSDSGFVLLAFATTDPTAWGAARTWLLLLPVAKCALLGWAAATGRTFGTRSIRELRGWARRGPLLAMALVLIALATSGLPGFVSWDARITLLRGAFAEPLRTVALVGSLTSLLVMIRLFGVGLDRPTALVQAADGLRPRRPAPDLRRRIGATAAATLDLNRVPLSAVAVLALAVLAASLGAGMFGLRGVAAADPPAALPGPEPSTGPESTFRPVPTDTPRPSARPGAS